MATKDVFLNIAGGLKVSDPAIDLAIISSILSSAFDTPINGTTCFAAEIGLSGEIRPVSRLEQRISEAKKLGMQKMVISKYNTKGIDLKSNGLTLVSIGKVEELVRYLFGKNG